MYFSINTSSWVCKVVSLKSEILLFSTGLSGFKPREISQFWSPAMKRTLHHSNKTYVALKCHMVTYTMMERAGKHSEQLAYRMVEYVVTDEAEKLAKQ